MLSKQSIETNSTTISVSESSFLSVLNSSDQGLSDEICTIFIIGFPDDFKERELVNMFLFAPGYQTAVLKTTNIPTANLSPSTILEDSLNFRKQLIGFVKFSKTQEALYALEILNGRILDQERGLVLKAEIAKKNLFVKATANNSNSKLNIELENDLKFSLKVNNNNASPMTIPHKNLPVSTLTTTSTRAMSITLPGQTDPLLIQAPPPTSTRSADVSHISIPIPVAPISSQHNQALNCSIPTMSTQRPSSLPNSFQYAPSQASLYIHRSKSPLSVTSSPDLPSLSELSNLQKTLITSCTSLGSMAAIVGENFPCNTIYVGNLPPIANEEELRTIFRNCLGYKRLSFRPKSSGPMCFVEFEDIACATAAIETLYGTMLTCSSALKGGIRLSFSKNPLGLRVSSPVPQIHALSVNSNDTVSSSPGSGSETDSHSDRSDHQQAISSIFAHYYKHNHNQNLSSAALNTNLNLDTNNM